jgi:hypothetical protein
MGIGGERRAAYLARVGPLALARLDRLQRGLKHPVHDFLFEYYPFKPGHLLRWSPGAWDAGPSDWPTPQDVAGFVAKRADYLRWCVHYLRQTGGREPAFGCFGLHEWAMVYRSERTRHPLPLRLSAAETDAVVEAAGLRCTHFDAYRFFTPQAEPLNRLPLTRAGTSETDQPGCVHVVMDLYKWAYKVAPHLPGEVLADAFELAVAARELDMRASPYDLSALGYEPVCIEARAGREEYAAAQRELSRRAAGVRADLLAGYERLLRWPAA